MDSLYAYLEIISDRDMLLFFRVLYSERSIDPLAAEIVLEETNRMIRSTKNLFYALAVIISPSAFPGYNWMEQAVSDLSAESAPSRMLWNQIAALYGVCSVVCATCISIFVSDNRVSTQLFRVGMYLFAIMNWVSNVGYAMFPLSDSGKDIASFQEVMHMIVTVAVVLLSVASLVCLIVAGFKKGGIRGIGIWAAVALAMMMVGAMGQGVVPPQYFGIVERFSVFAAVGFNAVCGVYLFEGFPLKPPSSLHSSAS